MRLSVVPLASSVDVLVSPAALARLEALALSSADRLARFPVALVLLEALVPPVAPATVSADLPARFLVPPESLPDLPLAALLAHLALPALLVAPAVLDTVSVE